MGDKGASSPAVIITTGTTAAPVGTLKKAPVVKSKKPHVKPAHPKTPVLQFCNSLTSLTTLVVIRHPMRAAPFRGNLPAIDCRITTSVANKGNELQNCSTETVTAAIKELKERGGSSLQAIKNYMVSTFKIDFAKQATFINKYLKTAFASGTLVQTKGKGAAGSFKLAAKVDTAKPAAKAKSPKKISPATKKASVVSKSSVASSTKAPTKKATTTAAVGQKKKVAKGPGPKPPKAKTIKAKPATKSPSKKVQSAAANKSKAVAAKHKKVASKKATATAK